MKEWILYCVLCSLIYAMSVQAQPVQTSDVIFWNRAKLPVMDCAVFLPDIETTLGAATTARIYFALKAQGYSPTKSPALNMIELTQADSAGHKVNEYYTDRDMRSLGRNGNGSLYLTLSGIRSTILKKHKFIFRLYTVGRAKEIAATTQKGTLGQVETNVKDLPKCQPKNNY